VELMSNSNPCCLNYFHQFVVSHRRCNKKYG